MPDETLAAFRDHGAARNTLSPGAVEEARGVIADLAAVGVDLDDVTEGFLVPDGVRKFESSYEDLLGTIEKEAAGA
jgi:transaldolase